MSQRHCTADVCMCRLQSHLRSFVCVDECSDCIPIDIVGVLQHPIGLECQHGQLVSRLQTSEECVLVDTDTDWFLRMLQQCLHFVDASTIRVKRLAVHHLQTHPIGQQHVDTVRLRRLELGLQPVPQSVRVSFVDVCHLQTQFLRQTAVQ